MGAETSREDSIGGELYDGLVSGKMGKQLWHIELPNARDSLFLTFPLSICIAVSEPQHGNYGSVVLISYSNLVSFHPIIMLVLYAQCFLSSNYAHIVSQDL